MEITVATWNTQWRTPTSDAGHRIAEILQATSADIIVVTEGVRGLLPGGGYTVDAGPDWGYSLEQSRRKVIVWSRYPLAREFMGTEGATRGRLVVATAVLPGGPIRVVGVCIPWRDAHVRTGRCDAQPWSEHLDYLDRLERILPSLDDGIPTVVAGDFNQRIPRERQPIRVADRLSSVFADWTIHTAGGFPNGPHIDHIGTNRRLGLDVAADWPASDHLGRLSDHAGVVCRLHRAENSMPGVNQIPASEPDEISEEGRSVEQTSYATTVGAVPPNGPLTSELRTEMEDILRRSGDGLSHGATFQLRERGLGAAEIAAEREVSLGTTRGFLSSLDALLTGTLPTTKSAAKRNSYAYREMLNHPRSVNLDSHVKAQLRRLKEINSEVSFEPLNTRAFQYGKGKPRQHPVESRQQVSAGDACTECAAVGIIHSGEC
ncbi:endonuclease/exonuclease/phosphatase family protein [Mycolicibacterium brumae]|uniref:endonuclease/exonuclease/phosphatase family protein n=1 Tax=Mycolicibacterium brumae TaxID=85968 RepID=UPI000FFA98CB|nr:endonuclease/exonuclease/phosphatase family protein [Mycolicibacterium brumae]RWA18112.1 hypothetical protein MBRU_17955 [Mycolicibacterium brumae DSM 44177]UWW10647.1 endonuclease/exonuclease/phosphatase family protein [Mycolicibacterium brumae]